MADTSEDHLAMWSKEAIIRELVGSVAIAVQRGGAIAYLDGYDKTLYAVRVAAAATVSKKKTGGRSKAEEEKYGVEEERDGEVLEEDGGEDEEGGVMAAAA